jgi:hypothetical protein
MLLRVVVLQEDLDLELADVVKLTPTHTTMATRTNLFPISSYIE